MTRLGPRGEGRIGCILWALALGITILIAVKAVPVKIADLEFGDYIEEQAQFSGRSSGKTLHARIVKKARDMKIPLNPKNLKVEKTNRRVRIECKYTVTLDFGFYQYEWDLEHEIDRQIFIV